MPITVGEIVEGKVTGITKFGAFISLPEGQNGLIHISEISDDYVEKVEEYLKRDQVLKVKVLSVDNGKISLSLRQAKPKIKKPLEIDWKASDDMKNMSFEDKLSKFLKDSSEKHDQIKSREGKKGFSQRYKSKNYEG